ncbi:MAG TPA: endospore germination permease [Firmicutes bacterium]|nr:endospore germination permease [Bacillota bacterium]
MQLERGRISGRQLMTIIVLGRIVAITVSFPLITGLKPVQDGWLAALISVVLATGFGLWVVKLGNCFRDKTIVEYAIECLGPLFGRIVGLVLLSYVMWDIVMAARFLGDSLTVAIMPETPMVVFIIVTMALAANAARCGLEVFGRMAENSFFVIVVFLVLIWVLPYSQMDFQRLKPVLSQGPKWLLKPSISAFSFFTEVIVVGQVLPYLNRREEALKYTLLGIWISGVILVTFAIIIAAVFGATANSLTMPPYSLTRLISIGDFIERVEAMSMGVWLLSSGINLAALLWAFAIGLAQLCNLESYRFLIYPTAALAVPLSLGVFQSIVELERFVEFDLWGYYSIAMVLAIMVPLTLGRMIHVLRRKLR